MSGVKAGDTVSIHYTGTLADGMVFDSTQGREPFSFTVGSGEIIEGFDQAVRGMEVGETRDISIPPDQAYGEYDEEKIIVVPRAAFPPDVPLRVGLDMQLQAPSGEAIYVKVIELDGDEVTLDGNHLLAGETLNFKIELVSVDGQ
jgi:peptidylprolyl isomerase